MGAPLAIAFGALTNALASAIKIAVMVNRFIFLPPELKLPEEYWINHSLVKPQTLLAKVLR